MNRLGIVGCGITAAVTAKLLKQKFPSLSILILEKAKGTGGRMGTFRNSKKSSVDLGMQFITRSLELTDIQRKCYDELIESGHLVPYNESIEGIKSTSKTDCHFVCPKGSGSLVKYFLNHSDCEILFSNKVMKINLSEEKWILQCDNGSNQECDAVILTMPIPQISQLNGLDIYLQNHISKLSAVKYCSRFALGLFYDRNYDYFTSLPFSAKFIVDNPVIRFFSLNNRKINSDEINSVVIHTTKEFGKEHLNTDSSEVQSLILGEIKHLFPQMPIPSEIKFHKWRYSQVEKNATVSNCLTLSENPILICGGDGFTSSTFENCVFSAEEIVKEWCRFFSLK